MAKRALCAVGADPYRTLEGIGLWSLRAAVRERGLGELVETLRRIVPDISRQESRPYANTPFVELKRRSLQAEQCRMMQSQLSALASATIIDIGDSAGTHMLYMRALTSPQMQLETISVNLDPRAIAKIQERGLRAIHCRAEELASEGVESATLLTSFEMVEHLHNPSIFFRRLAVRGICSRMVISVPFVRQSRVGFHYIRYQHKEPQFAEDVHVLELSPDDWSLLLLHSGWRVVSSTIHYQYPRRWLLLSWVLKVFWRHYDYEGFWCAVLERDMTYSDLYQDWED